MCLANIQEIAPMTLGHDAVLRSAIDEALKVRPALQAIVSGEIDATAIALACVDMAVACPEQTPASVALMLAAVAIRNEHAARVLAEFQAKMNAEVIAGRTA
jgi:hypothetical protein